MRFISKYPESLMALLRTYKKNNIQNWLYAQFKCYSTYYLSFSQLGDDSINNVNRGDPSELYYLEKLSMKWFIQYCIIIDLFSLYALFCFVFFFSQCRSCDNSPENCYFQISSYSRALCTHHLWKDKGPSLISSSVDLKPFSTLSVLFLIDVTSDIVLWLIIFYQTKTAYSVVGYI